MIPGVIPRPSSATRPMLRDWPSGLPLLSVFHGIGATDGPASTLAVDRALGRRLRLGLAFLDQTSWTLFRAPVAGRISGYVGLRDDLIVGVPMVVADGSTLAQVVAGTYDAHFTAAATAVAACFPTAILRIGWEFNGNWYPWKANGDPTTWIAAFRRIVGLFRAVSPSFRVLWSPNKLYGVWVGAGLGYTDPEDCWPGDDVVDYVGLTCYGDWTRDVNAPNPQGATGVYPTVVPDPTMNADVRWSRECLGAARGVTSATAATDPRPFGLTWAKAFADVKGKPLIVSEWGVGFDRLRAGRNIGDDGYYVSQMIAWAITNGVFAMNYYDRNADFDAGLGDYTYNCAWSATAALTGFPPPDATWSKPSVAAAILSDFGA